MTQPVISICIPTYNRAIYLRHLLGDLARQIGDLSHSYEIVIADNASTDETESVVKEFMGALNIDYLRRDKNYGAEDNRMNTLRRARGVVQLYVADDDTLILKEVNAIATQMLADPDIGAVYAPWQLYNRAIGKVMGTFYPVDDIVVQKNDHELLLAMILNNHIFPEIYIIRSDLARAAALVTNPIAFWAFVHAAEFLTFGKIAFRKNPFYVSITKHFEGDSRQQLGHMETQDGWDMYRGGLEYLLSRISATLSQEKTNQYLLQIQKFIALRISVALRLRFANGRNPLESYYLAKRMKAMGYGHMVPIDDDVRFMCAANLVLNCATASDKVDKIVCTGDVPLNFVAAITKYSRVEPKMVPEFSPDAHPNAIVIVGGSARSIAADPQLLLQKHIRLFGFADLIQKFA